MKAEPKVKEEEKEGIRKHTILHLERIVTFFGDIFHFGYCSVLLFSLSPFGMPGVVSSSGSAHSELKLINKKIR